MEWNQTLACFTTGGLADASCVIGTGFNDMFGSGLVLAIVAALIALLIVYKMRLSLDLTALGLLGFTVAFSLTIFPSWVFYVGLLLVAIVSGYGFYRWTKSR